jgi:hypothetical protein
MRLATSRYNPACQEHCKISTNIDNGDDSALLRSPQFFAFFCENELSLQSGAHFADLISKMLRTCQFFPIFCKIELSLHSRVGSVRFGFVFQELVNFRFPVRFGSVPGNIIKKNGSVRFGFRFLTGLVSGS